jgi:hypothetical protein
LALADPLVGLAKYKVQRIRRYNVFWSVCEVRKGSICCSFIQKLALLFFSEGKYHFQTSSAAFEENPDSLSNSWSLFLFVSFAECQTNIEY